VGAWPPELTGDPWPRDAASGFVERIRAYMHKAVREAKVHSSWTNPDEAYEQAVADFIAGILDTGTSGRFLDQFLPFQQRIAEAGVDNSLIQLALKLTCPGVPDIYQGA